MPDRIVTVRLSPMEYDFVRWRARTEEKTVSDVIRDAIAGLPPVIWRTVAK